MDLDKPAVVEDCVKNHQCVNGPTGSGGAGSGGEMAGGAGGSAGVVAGNTGSSGASGSGGVGPGTGGGGSTGKIDGGAGGTGGATDGGGADRRDGSTGPRDGADIDAPVEAGSVEDTNSSAPEAPQDVVQAESGPGPDAEPDGPPDGTNQALDVSPDLLDVLPGEPISCIQEFQSNGYTVAVKTDSGILACSECRVNGVSKETPCKTMIDCLQKAWPCNKREAACWISCQNDSHEDMALGDCVSTLVGKACPTL